MNQSKGPYSFGGPRMNHVRPVALLRLQNISPQPNEYPSNWPDFVSRRGAKRPPLLNCELSECSAKLIRYVLGKPVMKTKIGREFYTDLANFCYRRVP
jgi:hypothetical protein